MRFYTKSFRLLKKKMEIIPSIMIVIVFLLLYMIPTVIGFQRKCMTIGGIMVLNFLLGWTIIGWIFAFVRALTDKPKQ